MKTARVAVLVLAVAAAGGAAMLALNSKPQIVVEAPQAVPVVQATDDILVSAHELPIGKVIGADDIMWQPWPKDAVAPFMIKRDPKVIADLTGSIVRIDIYRGAPIRPEALIKGANSGFLSAVLPSGMRAVAINIDAQGSTSAGGFVLPNDRVDVIRTAKAASTAANPSAQDFVGETLLTNVRVLAIGQNVQDKGGSSVVVGTTATLELDPVQAETIILAQRTGQLSLTLRSMLDAMQTGQGLQQSASRATTIIRYGVESEGAGR